MSERRCANCQCPLPRNGLVFCDPCQQARDYTLTKMIVMTSPPSPKEGP